MIPSTLANDIKTTLLNYLTTTFSFQDRELETALLQFLTDDNEGMFKGPYLNLRLPFRKQADNALQPSTLKIAPTYAPYMHQARAWARLSTQGGRAAAPTLITTGTGSGKTECFLYPVLDHCFAQRGRDGVKAIVLYPMNALASDQATRLASIIHTDKRLRGQIRAGLYVGGQKQETFKKMGPDYLIDDRQTLRDNPPDILLTNYKMLDFLLLRPEDAPLWRFNEPDTLRYLVLDELHTYDGAQGSDVACLIRRLRARLGANGGQICPVGTSATVGEDSQAGMAALVEFATTIFGVPFGDEAIIGEDRLSVPEFLPVAATQTAIPQDVAALRPKTGEPSQTYIDRLSRAWFGLPLATVALGEAVASHQFLRDILAVSGDGVVPLERVVGSVAGGEGGSTDDARLIVESFLALIAAARREEGGRLVPFLTVQVQVWLREVSRLMRDIDHRPSFFWRDDWPVVNPRKGLPMVVCRECGHSGWLAFVREGDERITDDTRTIYANYFKRTKHVRYLFRPKADHEGQQTLQSEYVCAHCLSICWGEQCPLCGQKAIPMHIHRQWSEPRDGKKPRDLRRCPDCQSDDAFSIVGSAATSLASVAISHLYTSPLNHDKKLIVFTDSVQDASHRAGFYGARTYRFGLRTAVQAVVEDERLRANSAEGLRLDELAAKVLAHWRAVWSADEERVGQGDQKAVAAFMPPDLREWQSYADYVSQRPRPLPDKLARDLSRRLGWEIVMEYGMNARIGRSLEKAGSSVAQFDEGLLTLAIDALTLELKNEIGLLRQIDKQAVGYFIRGLLTRTRLRGGVTHALLERYAESNGNRFQLNKKVNPLLSPFGARTPTYPRFLSTRSGNGAFDGVVTSGSAETWFVNWARRTLHHGLGHVDCNEVYRLVLSRLSAMQLCRETKAGKATVYGICADVLWVSAETTQLQCTSCSQRHTVGASEAHDWLGQACLRFRCVGHYSKATDDRQAYYRDLYARGAVERIFAQEHTGLLERDVREDVENQFRLGERADAANLLVATPTLEMGIDVGDLSATMASSIPPAPANYLQRIGRAGRKTGNALVLALANTRPHDLYFFAEPSEMIAGTILPPGCFLDAPRMLERQLVAFTLDNWAQEALLNGKLLPRNVKTLLIQANKPESGAFPHDWLTYVKREHKDLTERFFALFGDVVSAENRTHLAAFGQTIASVVFEKISAERDEIQQLLKERDRLAKERKKIEADPHQYKDGEAEINRLIQERSVVIKQIARRNDKYILNFFTDAGLLPNYAFPETGVKLDVVIVGDKKEAQQVAADSKNYSTTSYIRSASQAIKELAPFNTFYAQGRKLKVSHVNVSGKDDQVERWQFCPRCSYLELVQSSHHQATCPACGSHVWNDAGQQHDMLPMRQVMAWTQAQSSMSNDDADDRERESYATDHFFSIPPDNTDGAHLLADPLFGLEYHNDVTLREINFGPRDTFSKTIEIASSPKPLQGFQICPSCGVVYDIRDNDKKERLQHTRRCTEVKRSGGVRWHNLYLYRSLNSEAIRVLLPVSTWLVEERLATMQAVLALGLKKKFRGKADHLRILPHTEVASNGERRRFLIIYDTVPGGTSFLRDLIKPNAFRSVLQLALDTLTACSCAAHPNKPACYRCLYSYQDQYELHLIKRATGVEMLTTVLAGWDGIQPVATLSTAAMDSVLESELEQKFIDGLATYASKRKDATWTVSDSAETWHLTIGNQQWEIVPQVPLGTAQGLDSQTVVDFVFYPASKGKPIAVYLDGFAYHVQPHKTQARIAADSRTRKALLESGQFLVWTLTWDDVEGFVEGTSGASWLDANQAKRLQKIWAGLQVKLPNTLLADLGMEQLLAFLERSDAAAWQRLAMALNMIWLTTPPRPTVAVEVVETVYKTLHDSAETPHLSVPPDSQSGGYFYKIAGDATFVTAFLSVRQDHLKQGKAVHFRVLVRLNDQQRNRQAEGFKSGWQRYWALINLWQFLPLCDFMTSEAVEGHEIGFPVSEAAQDTSDWQTLLEETVDMEAVIAACQEADVAVPIAGYVLTETREIAELAWPETKIAVFPNGDDVFKAAYQNAGWQAFFNSEIELLLAALSPANRD